MADTRSKVPYYHVEVPDKSGEAVRILHGLKDARVNLLAFCGFPIGDGKAQLDLVPEHDETFRKAAARLDLSLSERKSAFLIQGSDRVGAVADAMEKLAAKDVNIVGSQALCAGGGRWGMIFWVKPADYEKASTALGL